MEEATLVSKVGQNFAFFGGMSLLYGILFTVCMYQNPNGITFPIIVLITIVFSILYVKKIGQCIRKDMWLYAAGMMLLGISSCLTSSSFLIFFNLIGIFLLFLVMMIHQFYQDEKWRFQTYFKNLFIIIGTTIAGIRYPFKHASVHLVEKSTEKKKTAVYVFTGIGIAVLLLIVIFPLLIHSDEIFAMYFGKIIEQIHLGKLFWMFVMTAVMSILCYAFFSALCEQNLKMNAEPPQSCCNPIVGITFTSILAVIYLAYSAIQIFFLFFGLRRDLLSASTYSSYARSGFWELIFVSVINFVLILVCVYVFEENNVLKGIVTIISMCTFIMIFSAAYRMCRYIEAYHLTFLRVLVLWFLFLLALIMGGTVFSIYRKQFPLFRYIMFMTACCYIGFSLAKPDYRIVKYNVNHMEKIRQEDLEYFIYGLSDDAAPIIAEISLDHMMEQEYRMAVEEDLRMHFKIIQKEYSSNDIRKMNYSHIRALKAAEKYLENH